MSEPTMMRMIVLAVILTGVWSPGVMFSQATTTPESITAVDAEAEQAWLKHGLTAAQRDSVRTAFRAGIRRKFIPGGSLLIIHRGETVFREAFGVADLETGRPFSLDAPCRIASLTKPHTATLMTQLVEQHKLSWDDPIDKYLPKFAHVKVRGQGVASRPPKVRELLSHTAGFPGNAAYDSGQWRIKADGTLADAVDDLAEQGLATEPGSGFVYTGTGYLVAGRIAEVVSGRDFNTLMREQLLAPIGATTAVFYSAAPQELVARMPTLYERKRGQFEKRVMSDRGDVPAAKFPTAGGGLISTLDDVGRLFLLHRNRGTVGDRQLIAADSLAAMYRPQPATGRDGYGLGFNIMRVNDQGIGTRIRHTGAAGTLGVVDFDRDLVVVVLTQVPQAQTMPWRNQLMNTIDSIFAQ